MVKGCMYRERWRERASSTTPEAKDRNPPHKIKKSNNWGIK